AKHENSKDKAQQHHYHDDDDEELNDESSQGPEVLKYFFFFNYIANATQQQQAAPRFAYQTKPPKAREVPQLIHQDVHEPMLQVDMLVPEPELNEATIKSSPLAFMSVFDSLQGISDTKIDVANQYIEQMKEKATKIEKYGLDHLDVEFTSCGDVDADLEKLKNEIIQLQNDLFKLDETYAPVHAKLREINSVETELERYQDDYYSSIVQLRRIHSRINQVLQEHQIQRDSAMTALQATELQQGFMKSKISDKIAETSIKIDTLQQQLAEAKQDRIANQSYATTITGLYSTYFSATPQDEKDYKSQKELELEEELSMCNNFLTGLNEFLKGLKKLRKEQRNRITHLEQVIEQLHNQRAAVAEKIGKSESDTIEKLQSIRHEFILPLKQQIEKRMRRAKLPSKDDELVKSNRGAALSLERIVTKRVNRMNQVYKKLQDLENRAMTTGSREYLRGLTEIRELQLIMNNQYLKQFFVHFVSKANQIFHDFQLASMALMEQTTSWSYIFI
ncbi:myosin-2 heavy chain, non muscle, partial [Reticulomyxa filosa]